MSGYEFNRQNELQRIEQKLIQSIGKTIYIGDLSDIATLIYYHSEILNMAANYKVTIMFHQPKIKAARKNKTQPKKGQ